MRMMGERRALGVEDGGQADARAQMPHDLETVGDLRVRLHLSEASHKPSPQLPRERFRPYVDTGRPRRKQALLVQMVVREKL